MPKTYDQIATTVVSGSSTNFVRFSSIPNTYTDLLLVADLTLRNLADALSVYGNELNSNQNSWIALRGTGSSASSHAYSNRNTIYIGDHISAVPSGNQCFLVHVMNYSNSNIFKTVLIEYSHPGQLLYRTVGTIRSTEVLNSLTVVAGLASGDRLDLYGIKAA